MMFVFEKKNKDQRKEIKQSHAIQNKNYVWFSQIPWEDVLGKAIHWDLTHANAGSLCVAGLDQWCLRYTKESSH